MNEQAGPPIEQAVEELEAILAALESSGTSLEESLARYERGVALLKHCYRTLAQAELRIQTVTGSEDGGLKLEPFAHTSAVEAAPPSVAVPAKTRSRKPAPAPLPDEDIPF